MSETSIDINDYGYMYVNRNGSSFVVNHKDVEDLAKDPDLAAMIISQLYQCVQLLMVERSERWVRS